MRRLTGVGQSRIALVLFSLLVFFVLGRSEARDGIHRRQDRFSA